jgi:hypothetical protein
MSVVSSASLEALNRLSPACSTTSLERFLSNPMEEEGVPISFIKLALQTNVQDPTWVTTPPTAPQSRSSVNSGSSIGSIGSFHSCNSHVSTDSRGSRRGRKQWRRILTNHQENHDSLAIDYQRALYHSPETLPTISSTSEFYYQSVTPSLRWLSLRATTDMLDFHCNGAQPKRSSEGTNTCTDDRQLFCTWPSCMSRFRYRFAWTRHEEAVHYCPFHWVCCRVDNQPQDILHCIVCRKGDHTAVQHCSSCATKDLPSRTFLREDQLAQHIKRVHPHPNIPKTNILKDILSLWKTNNPSFPAEYLRCGFCGLVSATWTQRQNHVFDHLKKGMSKSLWQVEKPVKGSRATVKYVYKFPYAAYAMTLTKEVHMAIGVQPVEFISSPLQLQ